MKQQLEHMKADITGTSIKNENKAGRTHQRHPSSWPAPSSASCSLVIGSGDQTFSDPSAGLSHISAPVCVCVCFSMKVFANKRNIAYSTSENQTQRKPTVRSSVTFSTSFPSTCRYLET